ncbi:MAG: hypothetical protein FWC62_00030 [Firmicutes bacterium]|nr:hypothetical protein [Bacillota bacterium]
MRNVLEALYNGDIRPDLRDYEQSAALDQLEKLKARNLDELMGILGDAEREVFGKYCDAQEEIEEITQYDTYAYALKFGILLMAEVFMTGSDVTGEECIRLY